MKIRKSILKWLVWVLAFFLVAGGVAQGADRCRQKCCEEFRGSEQGPQKELKLHPETPLDIFFSSCHMAESHGGFNLNNVLTRIPHLPLGDALCDDGTPSCCHLGKNGAAVQALASKNQAGGTYRPFQRDMVFHGLSPDSSFCEGKTDLIMMTWVLHPRAAPVPLYLKNASFIC